MCLIHLCQRTRAAPQHLLPEDIPYNLIQFGPAFPSMGGLILEFPSLELAMRISAAMEQSTSSPKVIMLPTIHVRPSTNGVPLSLMKGVSPSVLVHPISYVCFSHHH